MIRSIFFLAALTVMCLSQGAAAQNACSTRAEVLKQLSSKYEESPVAMGLASNGGLIEVLASKKGNSWTIIMTMPNGMACMVAAGQNWEALPQIAILSPEA